VQRIILALVAGLSLASGCGQSSPAKISVTLIESEAGVDALDGATAPDNMARCCAMAVAGADAGDASGPGASDNCSVLARHTLGVVEPCLNRDSGAGFGAWTCGADWPQAQCADNGLSCNLGDPCTLVDVGCPGVVQACTFTAYTPPPG
jgi:hypothetical protein